ncbi:hypothetical protein TR51_16035 [Kitasatospora griseola]|uniref:Uncharacterized protein n=1 Tax=Kitasatospora griseola TaxID=2064 RepID=A0A0D0PS55_KITGR|nr:RlpA-like double-psi beta-barrel domain-containing protein [Kitasatospora griseola]KIQ65409.1 hypothetical protein TR51_16035 [Kitasatospora griseola]
MRARTAKTGAAALLLAGGITLATASPSAAYTGRATHYPVGLGACGQASVPSDLVVALSPAEFGNGYSAPHCFQSVWIQHGGTSIVATVLDRGPAGMPLHDLDLSLGAFMALGGDPKGGPIDVSWGYVETSPGSTTTPPGPGPIGTTMPAPTGTTKAPTPTGTPVTQRPAPTGVPITPPEPDHPAPTTTAPPQPTGAPTPGPTGPHTMPVPTVPVVLQ